jgi:hypothetical protein
MTPPCRDVYCPDCGQGFSQVDSTGTTHAHLPFQEEEEKEDFVFKKPTILTKVFKSLWKPFGGAKPAHPWNQGLGTERGSESYPETGAHEQRQKQFSVDPRHGGGRPRIEDCSDVTSRSGSWIGSILRCNWNRKRPRATGNQLSCAASESEYTNQHQCSVANQIERPCREPFFEPRTHQHQPQDFQLYGDANDNETEEELSDYDGDDEDADSDRKFRTFVGLN